MAVEFKFDEKNVKKRNLENLMDVIMEIVFNKKLEF